MPKKLIIIIAVVIIALVGATIVVLKTTPKNNVQNNSVVDNSQKITLYYSSTCPHCLIVEKFINDNKIKDKVSFEQKEVSTDKAGASEMMAIQKTAGVDSAYIGSVPFLWDGVNQKYFMGDSDIINFFQEKIK